MSKFSITTGAPIARIVGGASNKLILRIKTGSFDKPLIQQKEASDEELSDEELCPSIEEIQEKMELGIPLDPVEAKYLNSLINPSVKKLEEEKRSYRLEDREFVLLDGMLSFIPTDRDPQRLWVCGPSNCGKSVWVSNYIAAYKKMHPKSKIFVFSVVNEDEAIDKHEPIRIKLDDKLVSNPIKSEEFQTKEGCLILFDDIDAIIQKKISKAVFALRDQVYTLGRHHNITVISTNHLLNNNSETKKSLNESSHIILFPKSGNINDYFMKRYISTDREVAFKIRNAPSRWVCFHKNAPQYILHSSGASLV